MELLGRMRGILEGLRSGDLSSETTPRQLFSRYTSVMDGLMLELYETVV